MTGWERYKVAHAPLAGGLWRAAAVIARAFLTTNDPHWGQAWTYAALPDSVRLYWAARLSDEYPEAVGREARLWAARERGDGPPGQRLGQRRARNVRWLARELREPALAAKRRARGRRHAYYMAHREDILAKMASERRSARARAEVTA